MRPEVSIYPRKVFYDGMFDHESVFDTPIPLCFDKNVQFINYNVNRPVPIKENQVTGSTSKVNVKEAELATNLAWFLIRYGYKPSQITIVTYYNGQVAELRRVQEKLKRKPMGYLRMGVDIQTVDNFQGQENDIIIISCVRANAHKAAGFTKVANRTNVALSRARQAMFVIGDFEMLKAKGSDNCWRKIYDVVEEQDAFTDGTIEIGCRQHDTYKREVDIANSELLMHYFPKGGCTVKCDGQLQCGHACEWECHNPEFHERDDVIKCYQRCERTCDRGHQCTRQCHDQCPPCPVMVKRSYFDHDFKCKCTDKIECGTDFEYWMCDVKRSRLLSCGHQAIIVCSEPVKNWRCIVKNCGMRQVDELTDSLKKINL